MKIENISSKISVNEFLEKYVHIEKFLDKCKECNNFNNNWSCPEFDFNPMDLWNVFKNLELIGVKFTFEGEENKDWNKHLEKVKDSFIDTLISLEKKIEGSLALFPGSCEICGRGNCKKIKNLPCIYPEKMRHSIEALGGDVGLITKDLLELKLSWFNENEYPEYLIIVGGLLY